MNSSNSQLFSTLKIKDLQLKNRIVMSPMCQYSSIDGFSNQWHLVHIGSRAVGGAGLIIMEAAAVSPEGRITPDDLGIWKDEHIKRLKEIVDFSKAQNAAIGIQLAHAGRKASTTSPWKGGKVIPSEEKEGWKTIAPSPIPFFENEKSPQELDEAGIQKVIQDFKNAARRALKAGFDVIEIHAAHGYLLHEFLSPLSNKRTDKYGGSFENRIRLILEVLKAVKTEWPEEKPLLVRISATDWVEDGWNSEESVELAKILKQKGVDLIDCSSGGLVPHAKIPVEKAYQVPFSEKIKNQAEIMTGAVGLITKAQEAEEILQKNQADLIFLGRELLRNPYFPLEAGQKLNEDISWPPQYERAKKKR